MVVKSVHLFLITLGIVVMVSLGMFAGMIGYRFFLQKQTTPAPVITTISEPAIVSGFIQYNGIRPIAGQEDLGKVILYQRVLGEMEFQEIPIVVPLVSAATWAWSGAESGKTYELQAAVEFLGKEISRSNTVVVTAPASGEQLTFNVSSDQVPSQILGMESDQLENNNDGTLPTPRLITIQGEVATPSASPEATPPPTVPISGRVNLSGYLPPNTKLALKAVPDGSTENFQVVTTEIEVKDNSQWTWAGAESGKRYRLYIELQEKDVIRGRSEEISVAAPAENQSFQIISNAKAPYERAAIVGKIDLNGPVANNSSILILQRSPGQTNYSPVVRIPAGDGQSWSFDDAVAGTLYEMSAALQVNEVNTSTANAVTLTAPASNIVFRINTNVSLNAPGQPRLSTCGNRKDNGKWPAEILFDDVSNSNSYWFQVGSTAGANDAHNERRNNSSDSPEKITVELENNKEYFARYAQAQCSDCRSDSDYSGFSETVRVICGGQ